MENTKKEEAIQEEEFITYFGTKIPKHMFDKLIMDSKDKVHNNKYCEESQLISFSKVSKF